MSIGHWISGLLKPWYVWRPWQLTRRARAFWVPPHSGYTPLPVAWGVSVMADPSKMIGRSIWTTGVYDLTVSEILARLICAGDTVIDAGANVGYMTVLAGVAAGRSGRVLSWEPHPQLFSILQQNVSSVSKSVGMAEMGLRNAALGRASGTAELIVPDEMSANDGLSYIGQAARAATSIPVRMETIDDVVGTLPVSVLKLDVEGFEAAVLSGAKEALAARRIQHIIFEDHKNGKSDVATLLESFGYELFSIGWSIRGPKVHAYAEGKLAADYEAPSYLASLAPDDVRRRCAAPGWRTLSGEFSRQSRAS